MDVLFGVLVGLTLGWIVYKWLQMKGGSSAPNNTPSNGGGGGYTGVNDGVAGELPKDRIE